jgi:hypothetical protein
MFSFIINFVILEKGIELLVFISILIISIFNYVYQTFQKYLNNITRLDKNEEKIFLNLLSDIFRDDVVYNSIEALKNSYERDILLIIDIKNNTENIYYVKSNQLIERHQGLIPTHLFTLYDLNNKIYKIEICRSMIPNRYILYNKTYQIYKNEKYFNNLSLYETEIKNKFIQKLEKNIRIKIEETKNNLI